MKKILTILSALFLLTGCVKNNQPIDVYLDTPNLTITNGNIKYIFSNSQEYQNYGSDTFQVIFTLTFLSSNPKQVEYKITDSKFIREKDGAEYSNLYFAPPLTITLSCDIKRDLTLSCFLPSSIKEEDYCFTFVGDDQTYNFHLYDEMIDYVYPH